VPELLTILYHVARAGDSVPAPPHIGGQGPLAGRELRHFRTIDPKVTECANGSITKQSNRLGHTAAQALTAQRGCVPTAYPNTGERAAGYQGRQHTATPTPATATGQGQQIKERDPFLGREIRGGGGPEKVLPLYHIYSPTPQFFKKAPTKAHSPTNFNREAR